MEELQFSLSADGEEGGGAEGRELELEDGGDSMGEGSGEGAEEG